MLKSKERTKYCRRKGCDRQETGAHQQSSRLPSTLGSIYGSRWDTAFLQTQDKPVAVSKDLRNFPAKLHGAVWDGVIPARIDNELDSELLQRNAQRPILENDMVV
ncbi:hypothetical protein Tdes44962_MAKER00693 [Teratosphaeria destructans]|uniref:Uncharacterized protein n=1 Tax=Teratosphaeria destructans TaxID=418781 RepID=A0A9W7W043_9PEZI|nr:hypothetical protein Tdes44962_MAKER00693 [Teratosphaeria destructans]